MLHPSYSDLMQVINKDAEEGKPIVSSRYSIVMAASKRARQLIASTDPREWEDGRKPLSTAVDEIAGSSIKILNVPGAGESADETDPASKEET